MKILLIGLVCLCAIIATGCATHIGSTYNSKSGTYLGAGGSFAITGLSGQVVVSNLGKTSVRVTVRDAQGVVVSDQNLAGQADCMVTVNESDEVKVVNSSKRTTEIKVDQL